MMTSRRIGLLESYNSCHDAHLANYLLNERVHRHLKDACIISDDRRVLTEESSRMKNDILEKKCTSLSSTNSSHAATSDRKRKLHYQFVKTLEKLECIERVARVRAQDNENENTVSIMSVMYKQDTGKTRKQKAPPVVVFDPTDGLSDIPGLAAPTKNVSISENLKTSSSAISRSHQTSRGHYSSQSRSNNKPRYQSSLPTRKVKSSMNGGQQRTMVTLYYFGTLMTSSDEDEIKVVQQCTGNSSVTVYKGHVSPNNYFSFRSRPHAGSPFSLTLYINGQSDSRVSTCCECKHTSGGRLSGKNGYFAWVSVQGGVPCYRCQPHKVDRDQPRWEDMSSSTSTSFSSTESDEYED